MLSHETRQSPDILLGQETVEDPTFSDDLEALYAQEIDTAAWKKQLGVVIQHRSWKVSDAFRSDDDKSPGTRVRMTIPVTFSNFLRHTLEPTDQAQGTSSRANSVGKRS